MYGSTAKHRRGDSHTHADDIAKTNGVETKTTIDKHPMAKRSRMAVRAGCNAEVGQNA